MAVVNLTVEDYDRDGLVPTFNSANNSGNSFTNTGDAFIYVKNTNGSDRTVTIVTQRTIDGLAVADKAVVVATATEAIIGPFPTATYNDGDGKVQLTYSAVTGVTVAVAKKASTA